MPLTEKAITLNGQTVNFWEDGQNHERTLLLVHGGIGDAHLHWSVAMPILAENFRVLAPDLPGFGKTALLPSMKTEVLMDWLGAFLKSQNCEQAVVVGNSFGGLIARLFAATHPAQVPAAVLVNGGGVPDVPGALRLIERIPGLSQALFYLFGRMATGPGMLKRLLHIQTMLNEDFQRNARAAGSGFAQTMRMLVGSPMPAQKNPIVPTLILWGANDGFAPLKEGKAVKNSIPGATFVEIAECGHMPQLETPDVFVWQINTFLEGLSRPARAQSGPRILSKQSG